MRTLLIFFLIPLAALAGEYDKHYDSEGTKQNYGDFYEGDSFDTRSSAEILQEYYDSSNPESKIPEGAVDKPGSDINGYGSGNQYKAHTTEGGLQSIMKSLQNGTDLGTFGKTYMCTADEDKTAYPDKASCQAKCSGLCTDYIFNVDLGCQRSEEIVKIYPADRLANNPKFKIKYNDILYTTSQVTAVCGNGFMSGSTGYIWDISKDKLSFITVPPNSPDSIKRGLGQCLDVKDKPFLGYFQDYYKQFGNAFQTNISKLGYVPSTNVNTNDLSLSVNVIVAGACDNNALQSSLPNGAAIAALAGGVTDTNTINSVKNSNEAYKIITEGTNYRERSCTISNKPSFKETAKAVSASESGLLCSEDWILPRLVKLSDNKYALDLLDGHEGAHQDCGWALSQDPPLTEDGWHRMKIFEAPNQIKNLRVNITGSLLGCISGSAELSDAAMAGGPLIDCPGYWPANDGKRININYSYSYDYVSDGFTILKNDNCSSIPDSCSLREESICGIDGTDCVTTVKDGARIGSKPSKTCQEVSTNTDRYMVCADGTKITAQSSKSAEVQAGGFFTTKRVYSCEANEKYDYSGFIKQDQTIAGTLSISNNGDIKFKGIDFNGTKGNYSTNLALKNPECQPACKVSAPIVSSEEDNIVIDETKTVKRPSAAALNGQSVPMETTYYKSCNYKDNNTWVCPIESGEKKLGGCGCIDDFADVIVELQTISSAANSMVCSDR